MKEREGERSEPERAPARRGAHMPVGAAREAGRV